VSEFEDTDNISSGSGSEHPGNGVWHTPGI